MKPYIAHLRNIRLLKHIHPFELETIKDYYHGKKTGHGMYLIKHLIGKPLARDNERLKIDLESQDEILSFKALMHLLNINNSITVRRNKCKAYINPITRSVYDKRYKDTEIDHIEAFSLNSFTKRLFDSDILRLKRKSPFDSNGSYNLNINQTNDSNDKRTKDNIAKVRRKAPKIVRGERIGGNPAPYRGRRTTTKVGHLSYQTSYFPCP